MYALLEEGIPSVVWVTIGMADRAAVQEWYTYDGSTVQWSVNDHGSVLIGYNEEENTVTVADPIEGKIECSAEQFESVYEERGKKCVILKKVNM